MAETTFDLDGYYIYNNPNPSDSGHTHFTLTFNPSTSTVRGSGKDNAGAFTIVGIFDGVHLRWIKRYPSWEWVYVGKTVDVNIQSDAGVGATTDVRNTYRFVGGWGDGKSQYGTFVLDATKQNTVEAHVTGAWSGNYFYNSQPGRVDAPMKLFLAVLPNNVLHGEGEDQCGAFDLDGTISGTLTAVHLKKKYVSGTTWAYDGQLANSETDNLKISGTWGDVKTALGTFAFNKESLSVPVVAASGIAIAKKAAEKVMPPTGTVWGKLPDESVNGTLKAAAAATSGTAALSAGGMNIAKQDVDKLLLGFAGLR